MGHGREADCAGFPHSSFPPSADVLKRCSGIEPSQTGRRGCCCFVFCYRCRCCCSWFICRKGSGARAIMKISHLVGGGGGGGGGEGGVGGCGGCGVGGGGWG